MSKVRKKNEIRTNLILKSLLENGQMSMPSLKEKTGMTLPVVTSIVQAIKEKKLIVDIPSTSNSVGRPAAMVKLNGKAGYVLGIDLDRIYTKFILLDLEQNIVAEEDKKISFLSNDREILSELKTEMHDFVKNSGITWESLFGIGISIPGIVNTFEGKSISYLNFDDEPIKNILEEYLDKPVHIEHDVKAMALGMNGFGVAKNKKNALCLKIDWGLGLGMIIDGKLYYGHDSLAGEFGHIPAVSREGELCYCGKTGCLETVASGKSIAKIAIEKIQNGEVSLLAKEFEGNLDAIDFHTIIEAAKNGDQFSNELLEEVARNIGATTAILINIFNPECIVLGGYIGSNAPSFFLDTIKISALKFSHSQLSKGVEFIQSNLGSKAGALGVAQLAAKEIFEIEHLTPWAYV